MKSAFSPWLLAACAAAGCTSSPSTQVLTGRATGAIAVRAIADTNVVTAGRVRSDGTFTLALPAGSRYRLEVMTAAGVQSVAGKAGSTLSDLAFRVCQPTDPFDLGGVGSATGGGCLCPPPPPPPCDPAVDGKCPPPPCDPATDPTCVPPPPPPMCDPATDPKCPPPPPPPPPLCDPTTDASCPPLCDPSQCPLPPPPCDPTTGKCPTPCDPTTDATCPVPPPPCADPKDPTSCKDPCMTDPSQCGGPSGGAWPPPQPPPCDPSGNCKPDAGSWTPDHLPGDFGCKGSNGS